jgi:Cupin-like domain
MNPVVERDARDPGALAAASSAGGAPCVVRGAVAAWPAVGRWSPEYLASAAPEWRVPVARVEAERVAIDRRRGLHVSMLPLRDFVASFADAAAGYAMAPLDALPPALARDLGEPDLCRAARWRSAKLWISARGVVTPLHFDVAHNFHAVLHGRKRFLLYPRADWFALYPESIASGAPNFSRVDPLRADYARFPRLRRARPLECTLEAGDALCIPGGVWHHVTSERDSVSVNFWWARGLHALAAGAADWLKRARGLSR